MEREESNVNFSTEDPENVVIPTSLPVVAYEYFDCIIYQLSRSDNLPIALECTELLREINKYSPDFLIHENRFLEKVFPKVKKISKLKPDSSVFTQLQLKFLEKFLLLILELDFSQVTKTIHEHKMQELSDFVIEIQVNINENSQFYNTEPSAQSYIQNLIKHIEHILTKKTTNQE